MKVPETVHQRKGRQQVCERPANLGPVISSGVQGILHAVEVPNHQGEGSGVSDVERASLPENTSTCNLVHRMRVRWGVNMKKTV
jgi:hypothetical protein